MFRLTLLVTSVLSFLYFVNPNSFNFLKDSGEKVLGIDQINQTVNFETVKTAILIYCINNQSLPKSLNDLYGNELTKQPLDLDKLYEIRVGVGCDFELIAKK